MSSTMLSRFLLWRQASFMSPGLKSNLRTLSIVARIPVNQKMQKNTTEKQDPRWGMFDRYMNILRNTTPPYDWNALKKLAVEGRKPLPYLFEIKTVHCLASLTEGNALADSNSAWSTFFEHIQKEGQWKFTGSNEIFDIHLALLLLEVDCKRYADQAKEVINKFQQDGTTIRKPVLHGSVFRRCLMHLSTISEENCRLATQIAINQDVEVSEELIKNLFKFNLFECFVEILKNSKNYFYFKDNSFFVLEKFLKGNCNEVVFQKLVTIMQDNSFTCPISCKHLLKSLLEKFRYNSKFTSVDVTNSSCKSCSEKMSSLPLQDFKECAEKACEVLLKRKDIFLNTTPQELNKFFDFIKSQLESSYYDCIVDGLNAINAKCARRYSMDSKSKNELRKIVSFNSKKQQIYNLEAVLDHCSSRFKKVLLFGRDHMANMFQTVQIPDNVTFYSLDNNTRDDPFIIYSALQSPNTYILSNDQFGIHKDLMNDEFFNRWLACRLVEIPADFVSFKYPPFHEVRVNIGRGFKTLHIPVASSPLGKQEWICAHLKS